MSPWQGGASGPSPPQQGWLTRPGVQPPHTSSVGLKRHTFVLLENASHLGFQEAEAFALYHKALDLQKHDRFEESAKAYHELLEARLLREVSAPGFPTCGTPSSRGCSEVGRVRRSTRNSRRHRDPQMPFLLGRHGLPGGALCPLSVWRRPCEWLGALCFVKCQSRAWWGHQAAGRQCSGRCHPRSGLRRDRRAGRIPSLSCCPDGLQTASRGSGLSRLCAWSWGGGRGVLERPPGPHCSPVEGGSGLAPRPARRPGALLTACGGFRAWLSLCASLPRSQAVPSGDEKEGLKHPGLMLKYSTYKNLAQLAAQREDLETAMEFYLEVLPAGLGQPLGAGGSPVVPRHSGGLGRGCPLGRLLEGRG